MGKNQIMGDTLQLSEGEEEPSLLQGEREREGQFSDWTQCARMICIGTLVALLSMSLMFVHLGTGRGKDCIPTTGGNREP